LFCNDPTGNGGETCIRIENDGYNVISGSTTNFNFANNQFCFKVNNIENANPNWARMPMLVAAGNNNRHYLITRYRVDDNNNHKVEIRAGFCFECNDWCEHKYGWLDGDPNHIYKVKIEDCDIIFTDTTTGEYKDLWVENSVCPDTYSSYNLGKYCETGDSCTFHGMYQWVNPSIGFEIVDCDGGGNGGDTHRECDNGQCIDIQGAGTNQCDYNTECRHRECSNDGFCVTVNEPGENECPPCDNRFSAELAYLIMILAGLIIFSIIIVYKNNLTYLRELFKMNTGRIVTVLIIAVFFSLSLHLSFVSADVSMQWDCSSGFGCSTHGDGCGSYKDIGNGNFDFVFDTSPGTYECEVEVKNCCYGFTSLGIRHRLMNTVMFTSMVSI
jgi:hypothetical protein